MCEGTGITAINWGGRLAEITPTEYACTCPAGERARVMIGSSRVANLLAMELPEAFRDWTLDTFRERTSKQIEKVQALREAGEWMQAAAQMLPANPKPFLFLHGPTGRGKTGLGVSVLRALANLTGRPARYVSMLDAFDELKARFSSNAEDYAAALSEVPLLFVDEVVTPVQGPWRQEVLFNLISRRHAHARPTIFATNMANTIEEAVTVAGWRRLRDASKQIVLGGKEIDWGR